MYDVFAPSTTPSIDNLILKKSYFHVNEHEECDGDPPAEWLDQQAAVGNSTSVLWRLRKMHGRRRAGTRWVDLIAERLEEQCFDICDAAPHFFANSELGVFIHPHVDGLHGT